MDHQSGCPAAWPASARDLLRFEFLLAASDKCMRVAICRLQRLGLVKSGWPGRADDICRYGGPKLSAPVLSRFRSALSTNSTGEYVMKAVTQIGLIALAALNLQLPGFSQVFQELYAFSGGADGGGPLNL